MNSMSLLLGILLAFCLNLFQSDSSMALLRQGGDKDEPENGFSFAEDHDAQRCSHLVAFETSDNAQLQESHFFVRL